MRDRPGVLVILLVSALHLSWAAMLMASADPLGTTPLSPYQAIGQFWTSLILVTSTLMAFVGLWKPHWFEMFIPQGALLYLSAAAGISAAMRGSYADGEPRSLLFILPDQLPSVLLALAYNLAALIVVRDRHA